jgi:hypothetical protein
MPTLLRQSGIIDNPRFDRAVALDLRQHHLAYLGQNTFVRPAPFTHKMQKRLMLGGHPRRGGHGCDRLDALALTPQHQPGAIVAKRLLPILVADHPRELLDVARKP